MLETLTAPVAPAPPPLDGPTDRAETTLGEVVGIQRAYWPGL